MIDAAMIEAARRWLMYACLAGLAAVVLIVFCSAVLPPLCKAWRRARAKSRAARAMFAAGVVAAVLYAGTKPTAQVTWDEYFSNKSYSIDTNDQRRISFAWTSPEWMPAAAKAVLHAFRRAATVPELPDEVISNAPMSAGAMTAVMQHDATNYVYFVECDWSPEPTVVTNGVYHVRAVENDEKVIPIGVSIRLPAQQENQQ
jgi:hypothetical protein